MLKVTEERSFYSHEVCDTEFHDAVQEIVEVEPSGG